MEFLWEFYQQQRLLTAELDAAVAKRQAGAVEIDLNGLQARVDRIELATHAMWTLIRDKLGMQDSDLAARVREIDVSDGRLDGKQTRPPVECPECHRTTGARRPACIYCGKELPAIG